MRESESSDRWSEFIDMPEAMVLRIAHLYAHFLNIYGDRGNILALSRRTQWRGIAVEVDPIGLGQAIDSERYDLYFIGGGQDKQQQIIAADLARHATSLRKAVSEGAVILSICGGYQLLGHYYKPHEGDELRGISLMDTHTVAGQRRMIGNVVVRRPNGSTLVGFENHSGKTFLGSAVEPLGKIVSGNGNNGDDGCEGAVAGGVYGTYLHGSLLPKNPALADELITLALRRRNSGVSLAPLDDAIESSAHKRALALPA
jgi:CobQ-like glutamine amidotransferase family enzyme